MATKAGSERDGVIYMFGSSCYEQLIITKGKKYFSIQKWELFFKHLCIYLCIAVP